MRRPRMSGWLYPSDSDDRSCGEKFENRLVVVERVPSHPIEYVPPHRFVCWKSTVVVKRSSLVLVPCAPDRKLLFGLSVLFFWNTVLSEGAYPVCATAMLRSSTCGR